MPRDQSAGHWPKDAAAPVAVLTWVSALNRLGTGARPESAEFIFACQASEERGWIRRDGRDRWITEGGARTLASLKSVEGVRTDAAHT